MKRLFAGLSLVVALGTSVQALACAPEAQFIATVKTTQTVSDNLCLVKLQQIEMWNENMMCPLDVETTQTEPILTECSAKPGDRVSGVMTESSNGRLSF